MTEFEFQIGIDRLKSVYGEKAYPRERTEIIYEKIHLIGGGEWNHVVATLIASARYAPMLDDIVKKSQGYIQQAYAKEAGRKQRILEDRKARGEACRFCGDFGVISAWKRGTAYQFSFRCPDEKCIGAGIHCNKNDTPWSEDWLQEYAPVFHNDFSHDVFEKASPELADKLKVSKKHTSKTKHLVKDVMTMLQDEPEKVAEVIDHQRDAHKKQLATFEDGSPIPTQAPAETNETAPPFDFDGPF